MLYKKHLALSAYLYLFIISLAIFFTAGMWKEGLFMDGLYYASIARNLSEGDGSFWNLHFTKTLLNDFDQHPPLAIYLESFFFRLFGDTLFTEKIYSFSIFMLNMVVIQAIWRRIQPNDKNWGWFPLLLWLSVYSITWAVRSNMLENTMMLFISASVYFILLSNDIYKWINLSIAGLFIMAAFLCKGPTALYVFSLPVILYFCTGYKTNTWGIVESVVVTLAATIPLLCIYFGIPDAQIFLIKYYDNQFTKSVFEIKNDISRTYILERCLLELLYAIGLVSVLLFMSKRKKTWPDKPLVKLAFAFILLGLCGVLPIMVSLKQRTYYINSTFIWFAFGLSLMALPIVKYYFEKIQDIRLAKNIVRTISVVALASSVIYSISVAGKPGRDKELVHDVKIISALLPKGTILYTTTKIYFSWSNPAYLYRYGHISLDDINRDNPFVFSTAADIPGYKKISAGTEQYHVFKRITPL